ncbi:MAG: hypothetical protein OHK0046_27630 [Anaerolineae bacterium]
MRTRYIVLLAVFFLLAFTMVDAQETPPAVLSDLNLERIQRATVYVMQTRNISGRTVVTCVGSGTIVSRSGLIATNAHNTVPNTDCPGTELIIALADTPGTPPIPTYRAEVAQANTGLDLALLRITQELSGRVIESDTLALPFVELADSDAVALDDTITVVGYPGIGNDPVDVYRGTVTGFLSEPSAGERAWIKTSAPIPGASTGGGVYNQLGQLIGVPTTVPVVSISDTATCIPIEDGNGDGIVNRSDPCIPIGGTINALRPANALRPLLRSASLGITVEKLTTPTFVLASADAPTFDRLFVSPSVTDGMPTTVARSLPTGTNRLFLFFDYRNMTSETIYELRVSINGIPNPAYSLAPVRWSGGTNGLWYIGIGSEGQTLPNGDYEFTLLINGLVNQSRGILIGASPQDEPTFSSIFFCIQSGENCFGTVYVLPTGNIVTARFIHRNVPDGTPWSADWYFNDNILPEARTSGAWQNRGIDTETVSIATDSGLQIGRYRLELYLDGQLAATADFTIAGASAGAFPRIFTNAHTTTALTPEEAVTNNPISSFPNTVTDIYALFDWEQLAPGTLWRMRWLVDNVVFYDELLPWANLSDGQNFVTRLRSETTIPDGTYRMELYVANVPIDLGENDIEAEVGIGQLPIDPFAQTDGVQLNGRIIDAETRQGLPGVSFILISEDYSIEDFTYNQQQVYTIAVTDREGRFQLDRLMEYDAPYSLVVEADGYLPIRQDGVVVDTETPNPMDVTVVLTRDR